MKVNTVTIKLVPDRKMNKNPAKLRGFFATNFPEYKLLHQHNCDKVIYDYPRVQYRISKGIPYLLGIEDGVEVLQEIYNRFDSILIDNDTYEIQEKNITVKKQDFGLSDNFYKYKFITPWFALNQDNFKNKYLPGSNDDRDELLRKTLIGNILSMSKSLGYRVPGEIKCDVYLQPKPQLFKGDKIVSFEGTFVTNFQIPDFMAIGKSVSRGFGAVEKCNS